MKLVSYNEENVNIGDALQTLTLQNFIKIITETSI